MDGMFGSALYVRQIFNQDISGWDVSNVEDMSKMFHGASSFNQNLSTWNVSKVTDMGNMFKSANVLSDDNKCTIHNSFISNENWPYDWEKFCSD